VHSLASLNDISLFLGIRLLRDHLVHDDAVIIDLSDLVEVPQIVEADLAVHGEEEPVCLPTDPHVDVTQAAVHVDEHYVVVEYEQVDDKEAQMDDEGQEVAHEARVGLTLGIVQVELE
jgi:hypothetical protein